jgi:hypothetical protein
VKKLPDRYDIAAGLDRQQQQEKSMTTTRVYAVTDTSVADMNIRLVRAGSQAQAIRHVVGSRYKAKPAAVDEVVQHMGSGVKVEEAGKEQDDE